MNLRLVPRRSAARGAVAAIVATALAAPGCGFGPGEADSGEAELTVTRDYGQQRLLEGTLIEPPESETVLRLLDREAEITTRYGGAFVQSINGIAGSSAGARRSDWFFFVNGIESSVGAADVEVYGGDEIWWDFRDWTDAMRVPAVVGSFPQPFAAADGSGEGTAVLDCRGEDEVCAEVSRQLEEEGVAVDSVAVSESGQDPRVLVGPWSRLGADPVVAQIEAGPTTSGVFARFDPGPEAGTTQLSALDQTTATAATLDERCGLVAAVREGEDAPTWLVTGCDSDGVRAAADLLTVESLRDHYALAVGPEGELSLPVLR